MSQFMNLGTSSLGTSDNINTRQNIIAGPGPHDYFFHSPGAQIPMIKEEGPLPVQGNIGSLVANEGFDYKLCGSGPNIGAGPNCTGYFLADIYTEADTCGAECTLKAPESYGLKDFGFPKDMQSEQKVTNAHQLHDYQNLRAGQAGQSASPGGCADFIPALSIAPNGTCIMNQDPVYSQVGEWNKLPMYQNITYSNFRR